MSDRLPFPRRFDTGTIRLIDQDFPASARLGLCHVLAELVESNRVSDWKPLLRELQRLRRSDVFGMKQVGAPLEEVRNLLLELPWTHVFEFCERVYDKYLVPVHIWEDHNSQEIESLTDVQAFFTGEINQLIAEENLTFSFVDGQFRRPGHYVTQKLSTDAFKVLGAPELKEARLHYQKALRFLQSQPQGDYPNSVKEAVSALESTVKALCPDEWKSDFATTLKRLQGTGEDQIPPTLIKSIEGVYAFRSAATGVAHGGATGGVVTFASAELVLNCVSSFITFFVAHRASYAPAIPF